MGHGLATFLQTSYTIFRSIAQNCYWTSTDDWAWKVNLFSQCHLWFSWCLDNSFLFHVMCVRVYPPTPPSIWGFYAAATYCLYVESLMIMWTFHNEVNEEQLRSALSISHTPSRKNIACVHFLSVVQWDGIGGVTFEISLYLKYSYWVYSKVYLFINSTAILSSYSEIKQRT